MIDRNYVVRSWNTLITILSKNAEFIPDRWIPDLERIRIIMRDKVLPKFIEQGFIPIYHNEETKDYLIGVYLKEATLFDLSRVLIIPSDIEQDNNISILYHRYITTVCNELGLKTTQDIQLNNIQWDEITLAMAVLEDFAQFGYSYSLQDILNDKNIPISNKLDVIDARVDSKKAHTLITNNIDNNTYNLNYDLFTHLYDNKIFDGVILKDEDYEVVDSVDLLTEIEYDIKTSFNSEFLYANEINVSASHEFKDCINYINNNAYHLYIETDNGRHYIPILYMDGQYMSVEDIVKHLDLNDKCIIVDYITKDCDDKQDICPISKFSNIADILYEELIVGGKSKALQHQRVKDNVYER